MACPWCHDTGIIEIQGGRRHRCIGDHRVWPVLVLAVLVLPALVIEPAEAAVTNSWTNSVAGVPDSISRLSTDGSGVKAGFAYKLASGPVGFSLFTSNGTVQQTEDISGNGTALGWTRVAYQGGSTWHILAEKDSATGWWYKSTDDGATWSRLHVYTGIKVPNSDIDATGAMVALAAVTTESPVQVRWYKSTNGAAPLHGGWSLSDNRGGPTTVGNQQISNIDSASVAIKNSQEVAVLFLLRIDFSALNLYEVKTQDGGAFWSIPYAAEGSSTQRALFSQGGSSKFMCGRPEIVANSQRYVAYFASFGSGGSTCGLQAWNNAAGTPVSVSTGLSEMAIGQYRLQASINDANEGLVVSPGCINTSECVFGQNDDMARYRGVYAASAHQGPYTTVFDKTFAKIESPGGNGVNVVMAAIITGSHAMIGYADHTFGDRFEVDCQKHASPLGPVVAENEYVSGSMIVGFDMDRLGTNVILRENGGTPQNIVALNARNLASINTVGSSCNRLNGVAAMSTHVFWVDCANQIDTDTVRIRSPTLGDPAFPVGCTYDGECTKNIVNKDPLLFGLGSDIALPSDLNDLSSISYQAGTFYQYESKAQLGGLLGLKAASTAFGFSTNDGRVGVWGVVYNEHGSDDSYKAAHAFDTTSFPNISQICTWVHPDGPEYMAAATPNGNTRIYEYDVQSQKAAAGTNLQLNVRFVPVMIAPPTAHFATGVACDGDVAMAVTEAGRVVAWQVGGEASGTVLWSAPATALAKGVALSGDVGHTEGTGKAARSACPGSQATGQFGAYVDGAVKIVHAGNGSVVHELPVPSGIMRGLRMDHCAQGLWVFTSERVQRIPIYQATTKVPTSTNVDDFGNVQNDGLKPSTANENSLQGAGGGKWKAVVDNMGPAWRFAFGGLCFLFGGACGWMFTKGNSPIVIGSGMGTGLVAAVFLGFWSVWMIIAPGVIGIGYVSTRRWF